MRHTTRLSALAVAGVLALAPCGCGSDDDTAAPAAEASTTVVTTTPTAGAPVSTPHDNRSTGCR